MDEKSGDTGKRLERLPQKERVFMRYRYRCESCGIKSSIRANNNNAVAIMFKIIKDHELHSKSCTEPKLRLEWNENPTN